METLKKLLVIATFAAFSVGGAQAAARPTRWGPTKAELRDKVIDKINARLSAERAEVAEATLWLHQEIADRDEREDAIELDARILAKSRDIAAKLKMSPDDLADLMERRPNCTTATLARAAKFVWPSQAEREAAFAPVVAEEQKIEKQEEKQPVGSWRARAVYGTKLALQTGLLAISGLGLKAMQNLVSRSVLADPTMPENPNYSPAGAAAVAALGIVAFTQLCLMAKARFNRA